MVPKKVEDEQIIKALESSETEGTDPKEEFYKILRNIGVKTGAKGIADAFFSGNIDNPEWLNYVLVKYKIPSHKRWFIITNWFKKSPEELGIDIESFEYVPKRGKGSIKISSGTEDLEAIEREAIKDLRRQIEIKRLQRLLEELEKPRTETTQTGQIVRYVPVVDPKTGEQKTDKQGRPLYETVVVPLPPQMQMMAPWMFAPMYPQQQNIYEIERRLRDELDRKISEIRELVKGGGSDSGAFNALVNLVKDVLSKTEAEASLRKVQALERELEKVKGEIGSTQFLAKVESMIKDLRHFYELQLEKMRSSAGLSAAHMEIKAREGLGREIVSTVKEVGKDIGGSLQMLTGALAAQLRARTVGMAPPETPEEEKRAIVEKIKARVGRVER